MPTLRILRQSFERAIASALLAGPTLSGCGPGPGIQKDPEFVPARCQSEVNLWLEGLTPEQPVDYLELKRDPHFLEELASEMRGEACKTASMVEACQAKLAELRALPSNGLAGLPLVFNADNLVTARLLVTRGDDVIAIDKPADLGPFLRAVDTPEDAMLVAQVNGHNVRCDGGGARPAPDGFEVQAYSPVGCGGLDRYLIAVHRDGTTEELDRDRIREPERGCAVGRRPAGLCVARRAACRGAGAYLARAAMIELASVEAFRRLAVELRVHGAPAHLIDDALAAARDEVRHARTTARLAQRLGARVQAPVIEDLPLRGLELIAIENAWEGCVRETFGALEGRWMAQHAGDPRVRRAYRRIAADELRHAALSWRVARWIEPRLGEAGRRRLRAARRAAIAELSEQLSEEPSPEQRDVCGVPDARQAGALLAQLAPVIS